MQELARGAKGVAREGCSRRGKRGMNQRLPTAQGRESHAQCDDACSEQAGRCIPLWNGMLRHDTRQTLQVWRTFMSRK